jgi:phosphoglycerate dehydrogenase-like enzyme
MVADDLREAVRRGGLEPTSDIGGADGLIWCSPRPHGLAELLDGAANVRWVQLPYAGIEGFSGLVGPERTWTCAKDIYGPAVAEFALGLMIAGLRRIDRYVAVPGQRPLPEQTLRGAHVTIFGGGGIGRSLAALLGPLGSSVTIVRRSTAPVGAAQIVQPTESAAAVSAADVVVLALPLTAETEKMVDADFLARMSPVAWLVNVARGRHVATDDLVAALSAGTIGGAALDVTDPEPLPDGHPLWSLENSIVTPHVANTAALGSRELAQLVEENVGRFARGEPLLGEVDPVAGY